MKHKNNELVLGNHLILDLFECNYAKINDINVVMNILHRTISQIGAQLISEGCKEFSPIGISAFAIISESHISVHTWPEYKFVAVDIFSCNKKLTEDVCTYIKKEFEAQFANINMIDRGRIGTAHK